MNITADWLLANGVDAGTLAVAMRDPAPAKPGRPEVPPAAEKPKRRRGVMNGLEARFARDVLDARKAAGEIDGWSFEPTRLLVAPAGEDTRACYLTIDFVAWKAGERLVGYETKGHWWSRDRVRVKVAADRHPWIKIFGVRWIEGCWDYEAFGL